MLSVAGAALEAPEVPNISEFVDTSGSGSMGELMGRSFAQLLSSLPRFQVVSPDTYQPMFASAPNRINTDLISSNSSASSVEKDFFPYFAGAGLVGFFPVLMLFLVILIGWLCMGCLCLCGKLKCFCKKDLTTKDWKIMYAMCGTAMTFFVLCLIVGIGSDVAISSSINALAGFGDHGVRVARDLMDVGDNIFEISDAFINATHHLNQTIFDGIPIQKNIPTYRNCSMIAFDYVDNIIFESYDNLTSLYVNITDSIDLDGLEATLANASMLFAAIPSLSLLQSDIDDIDARLANMNSSLYEVQPLFSTANSSAADLGEFNFTATEEALSALSEDANSLLAFNLSDTFQDIENGTSLLPDLERLHFVLDDANNRTTKSELLSNLTAIETALDAFPNMTVLANDLDDISVFSASLNMTAENLTAQLLDLQTRIESFPNLTRMVELLDEVHTELEQPFNLTSLRQNIIDLSTSFENITNFIPAFSEHIESLNDTLLYFQSSTFDIARQVILEANSTLDSLLCAFDVVEDFRMANTTLVRFPPTVNDYFRDYDDFFGENSDPFYEVRVEMDNILDSINSTESTLNDATIPGEITEELIAFDNASDFLNVTTVLDAIDSFNSSISDSDWFSQLASDLNALNDSLTSDDISNLIESMANVTSILSELEAITDQSNAFRELQDDVEAIRDPLNDAITFVEALPSEEIPPGSDFSDLQTAIVSLNNSVEAVSGLDGVTISNDMESSIEALPDLDNFASSLSDLESSTSDLIPSTASSSILDNLEDSLNATRSSLDMESDLQTINSTILELQNLINETRGQVIDEIRTALDDSEIDRWIEDADEMIEKYYDSSYRNDTAKYLDDTEEYLDEYSVSDIERRVEEYEEDFYVSAKRDVEEQIQNYESDKAQYREDADAYDNIASLFIVVLALIPFLVSLFFLCAVTFKVKCLATTFIIFNCCLLPFYLLFSAPFMLFTVLLSDQCLLVDELEGRIVDEVVDQSFAKDLDLPPGTTFEDIFRWYAFCEGNQPNLYAIIGHVLPENITEGKPLDVYIDEKVLEYNLTVVFRELESDGLTYFGVNYDEPILFNDSLKEVFFEYQDVGFLFIDFLDDVVEFLSNCSLTNFLYNFFISFPCEHVLSVFSTIALMLFLSSLVMMVTACCACRFRSMLKLEKKLLDIEESSYDSSGEDSSFDDDVKARIPGQAYATTADITAETLSESYDSLYGSTDSESKSD